jgi:predicted NUDIX family NTP pyrophosphohydrolase
MFKREGSEVFYFLVHPGGPFFKNKDKGWWGIPKGLPDKDEPLKDAARREFAEETGFSPDVPLIPLGQIKQKGGKIVHAWAIESDFPNGWTLVSNTMKIEWPPRSGKYQSFPEIDQGRFFSEHEALEYILPSQAEFIHRLKEQL